MSVINKMLNDLDQRKKKQSVQLEMPFVEQTPPRNRKWQLRLVMSIVSGVVAVMVSYWYYADLLGLMEHNSNSAPLVAQPPQAVTREPPIAAKAEPVVSNTEQSTLKPNIAQSDPELIILPSKIDPQKAAQRRSTLNVVAVQNQPPKEPLVNRVVENGPDVAQPTITEPLAPVQIAKSQLQESASVTSADLPKPPSSNTADPAKMNISKVNISPEQRIKKHYDEAKKRSQNGLITEAIEKYQQVLALKPDHQQARSELAALYYGRAMISEALTTLDQGLQLSPTNLEWSLLAAKIHYKRNNYGAAISYLQLQVHALDQMEYIALKATTYQKLQDYPAATAAYQQLTAAYPDNGRWWLGLATVLEGDQNIADAINAYHTSLRLSSISQSSRQFVLSRLQQLEN